MPGRNFVAFAIVAAMISTAVAIVCPDDYTVSGTKCLWYTPNTGNWANVRSQCEAKSGWLVSIKSSADQTSVENSRPITTDTYWIGLNDLVVEGSYRWLDGSMPFKDGTTLSGAYTNWNSGEPNNSNNEDCITLRAEKTWNDNNCDTFMAKGICETWSCPDDWVNIGGGKCLFYRNDFTDTWANQETFCEGKGGTLVTMKSSVEGDLVWNKRTDTRINNYWIGLHDRFVEGTFNWVDGSPMNGFTRWGSGEPNNYDGNENCGMFFNGNAWNDDNCEKTYAAICETYQCPSGYTSAGAGKCIKYSTTAGTYDAQKKFCEDSGGWLATVRNAGENEMLVNRRPSKTVEYFFGLNDIDVEESFKFQDDSSASYTNWASGEPNDANGGEDCGVISSDGKWNDIPCTSTASAICETGSCPNNYYRLGGGKCILNRTIAANWNDQKTYCENNYGRLVEIRSASENAFVNAYRSSSTITYIGLNDMTTEGTYVWPDGTNPSYTNWNTGEPSGTKNEAEDCVQMNSNSDKWNDISCDSTFGATCERWAMCRAGQYTDLTMKSSVPICTACPAGKVAQFAGSVGISSCQTCASGTYSLEGAASCTPCNLQAGRGSYASSGGLQSTCQCASGYFGSYCDIQCSDGQYWSYSASSCQQCASGTYSTTSTSQCTPCNTIGRYISEGLQSTCRCALGFTGTNCDIADCNSIIPGGSLLGLLLASSRDLRDYTKTYDANTVAGTLSSVRAMLKNILEQEVDINSNDEITASEALQALSVKSIYSKGMDALPVWCNAFNSSGSCSFTAVTTDSVLTDALFNYQTSLEHTFEGSGSAQISSLTSTYPDSSWTIAQCQQYDHGIYASTASNVLTSWSTTAAPTGRTYLKTCGYINGLKSSVFTTDNVLKGLTTQFSDSVAISTDNRYKRVYCIAMYYAIGCTDPPTCNSYTSLEVKTECAVGLYYVS